MADTKEQAIARAKAEGFPLTQVVASDKGGYFIAPNGVTADTAKKAYANCRENGGDQGKCAGAAHIVQKNHNLKHGIKDPKASK
jgi:hypothetical protein